MSNHTITRIDHLVYSTRDVEMSVADFQMRLGARLAIGGQHPGRGTRNALLALSDSSYLEVVGPDATQTEKGISRWFEIDNLDAARLVTWAVKGTELGKLAERARDRGVHLGPVVEGRPGDQTAHTFVGNLPIPQLWLRMASFPSLSTGETVLILRHLRRAGQSWSP